MPAGAAGLAGGAGSDLGGGVAALGGGAGSALIGGAGAAFGGGAAAGGGASCAGWAILSGLASVCAACADRTCPQVLQEDQSGFIGAPQFKQADAFAVDLSGVRDAGGLASGDRIPISPDTDSVPTSP